METFDTRLRVWKLGEIFETHLNTVFVNISVCFSCMDSACATWQLALTNIESLQKITLQPHGVSNDK